MPTAGCTSGKQTPSTTLQPVPNSKIVLLVRYCGETGARTDNKASRVAMNLDPHSNDGAGNTNSGPNQQDRLLPCEIGC